jgi:hypothetical protein
VSPFVDDQGDLGQLVVISDCGEQQCGLVAVGAGEAGRRGEGGVGGGGVEALGVETQPGVPADNGAVESGAVGADVDETEAQRVGEVELRELVGGRGGEAGRAGLKARRKRAYGDPLIPTNTCAHGRGRSSRSGPHLAHTPRTAPHSTPFVPPTNTAVLLPAPALALGSLPDAPTRRLSPAR